MNILSLWDEDYNKAKFIENRIANLLSENKNEISFSSENINRSATIRGLLTELQEHINALDDSLLKNISSNAEEYNFSKQQNTENRRKLIYELRKSRANLLDKFKKKPNVTIKPSEQLQIDGLPWTSLYESSSNKFQDAEDFKEITTATIHDNSYDDQENLLGEVQGYVRTVHSNSNWLANELNLHNQIIDTTVGNVDRAHQRISQIRRVLDWSNKKDQSTWSLIITFVILTIILVLIVFLL